MLTQCRASRRSRSYRVQRPPGRSLPAYNHWSPYSGLWDPAWLCRLKRQARGDTETLPPHPRFFCHTCSISKDSISSHSPPPRLCFALTQKEDKGLNINSLKSETTDIPSLSTLSLDTGEPMTVQIKETASLSLTHSLLFHSQLLGRNITASTSLQEVSLALMFVHQVRQEMVSC